MASIEKRVRDGQVSWRAHYRTPAGAQRNKTFRRKVDAERFIASVESAKLTGTYVDPALSKVTVGEWADRWLAGQAHLKPTTRERYAGIIRKQIKPGWGRREAVAMWRAFNTRAVSMCALMAQPICRRL